MDDIPKPGWFGTHGFYMAEETMAADYNKPPSEHEYDSVPYGPGPICGPTIPPHVRKISVAEIRVEEIDCDDLAVGVRTKPMREVETSLFATANNVYFSKHLDLAEKLDDGTWILTIESLVDKLYLVNVYDAWSVFQTSFMSVIEHISVTIEDFNYSTFRCSQQIRVRIPKQSRNVPVLQLYCDVEKLKYFDTNFKRGDIITLFIEGRKLCSSGPTPPLISISPRYDQTYVPMLPGQRLQIIVSKDDTLEWRKGNNDVLHFINVDNINEHGLTANYYECVKKLLAAEVFSLAINGNKKNVRTVMIPGVSRADSRYPIIYEPQDGTQTMVCSHNIDGFLLKSFETKKKNGKKRFQVDSNCPLDILHVYSKDCFEVKVRVRTKHPYFVLEGHEWGCVAKMP